MGIGIFDDDPKYQKLKALRDSGWKGPVDQNGEKVTSGPEYDILKDLAVRRGEKVNW